LWGAGSVKGHKTAFGIQHSTLETVLVKPFKGELSIIYYRLKL
jgi:hypothetical protein